VNAGVERTMRACELEDQPSREPDLRIHHLSIWVFGRAFPESRDFWDGNWLVVRAEYSSESSTVIASGTILHLSEIERLLKGCEPMYSKLKGVATLDCVEPNLFVRLVVVDGSGHVDLSIKITPDHLIEQHTYSERIDQSFLPAIIAGCQRVLATYPVVGRLFA
jgi:hypothetical protein